MKTAMMILLLWTSTLSADVKEIKRTIPAVKINTVELLGINGSEIEIRTWDKEEISVMITVDYSSSNKDKVREYLNKVDISESTSNGRVTLTYRDAAETSGGFSFSNFFNSLFSSYSNLKVSGRITIPASSAFTSDMRYGKYSVEGVKGNLTLSGVANNVTVRNCPSLQTIENNYGETTIEQCGGVLSLKGVSSTITVKGLNGSLTADANYSRISVSNVSADVRVICSSGEIEVDETAKNVTLDAEYSQISVLNTGGSVKIKSQSGTITVRQAANVDINALYSTITVTSVSGAGEMVSLVTGSGKTELSDIVRSIYIEDSYSTTFLNSIQGNVTLEGNTSNLHGKKVTGNLLVTNQYGIIDFDDLAATTVEISNKSIQVRLDLTLKPSKVQIDNEYGPVTLTMPDFSGDVKLKAKYGSISTNLPVDVEDMGGSAFAIGKAGNGNGVMNVVTNSGSIDIRVKK
jgi:hypothetical protein